MYKIATLLSVSCTGLAIKYPAGLSSEPKLRDLMNEVAAKIPGKWSDVGLELGLDQGVLDGIATSSGDTNRCYREVFTRWRNQNSTTQWSTLNSTTHPYTWLTIVHALQAPAVGEERLANEIKTELMNSDSELRDLMNQVAAKTF